jgi:hypothetical protein
MRGSPIICLTLSLAAGCQLATDFDRTRLLDAGTGEPDAGGLDAGPEDDAGPDAARLDAADDAGAEDAGLEDAGPIDAGPADGGPMDAGPADAGPADSGPPDTGMVDAFACTGDPDCDDSDLCTTDTCIVATGACTNVPVSCDDANVCTTDSCNPVDGACINVDNADPCDDGMACTAGDVCAAGACTPGAAVVALAPIDDGSGAFGATPIPDLVISEIAPGAYLELYNTTGSPIALSGTTHQLCEPFNYADLATLAPTATVPALGYAVVPWPSAFTAGSATAGEVMLYSGLPFSTSTLILDYVCWGGVGAPSGRLTQATGVGKWSGTCPAALAGGAIHRRPGTAGTTAADYDVVSARSNADTCVP